MSSTYRLQISPTFTLFDAADQLDYLADLGVGAVYVSPLLRSTTGSQHGYDWVDFTEIDPQRGGESGWQHFVHRAKELDLGIVLDIVPNHMGISVPEENPAWWSVLKFGSESEFANLFDIDWSTGRIALPVLADDSLDNLKLDDGLLTYLDHRFPCAPGTWTAGEDPRKVHDRQHYQLINWRDPKAQLNYRRFFAITSLIGLRVEDEWVAETTHRRILQMVEDGDLAGLRVDHIDGLRDPKSYLLWLRSRIGKCWLIVEKILETDEQLPTSWPIDGTSGYDALNEVLRVFIDPDGEAALTRDWQQRTGNLASAEDYLQLGRQAVVAKLFTPEINRTVSLLKPVEPVHLNLSDALQAIASEMHVYRSYLPERSEALLEAIVRARKRQPHLGIEFDWLTPQLSDPTNLGAQRFQQLTGAVLAKGVEDTAFYRYNRLTALNEVGGTPGRFGSTLDEFHASMNRHLATLPHSMTALSTHDTKRNEDVRARLAALSELDAQMYASWVDAVGDATSLGDPGLTVLLAQTLLGTGRIDPKRLQEYLVKAAREAALNTSWEDPDEKFETGLRAGVRSIYENPLVSDLWDRMLNLIHAAGVSNALSQKLVQLTMPGIPDLYQGTEIIGDSLVDPDNRRPVDFKQLRKLLHGETCLDETSSAKLRLVRTVLQLRRHHLEFFQSYEPLQVTGRSADHLIAFTRGGVITLATRLPLGLAHSGGWGETTIQLDGTFTDLLSGRIFSGPQLKVHEILDEAPVALLVDPENS